MYNVRVGFRGGSNSIYIEILCAVSTIQVMNRSNNCIILWHLLEIRLLPISHCSINLLILMNALFGS